MRPWCDPIGKPWQKNYGDVFVENALPPMSPGELDRYYRRRDAMYRAEREKITTDTEPEKQ